MIHLQCVVIHGDQFPTAESYPFHLPALRRTPRIDLDRAVTLLVGENGTGKSTLLEAIARRCGIHIWEPSHTRRFERNPHATKLHHFLRVEWTDGAVPGSLFSSQIFRHYSGLLDSLATADPGQLDYFGGKSLLSQSHGQSLMSYFRSRYVRRGLYLLDEPETALSPKSQLELLRLLAAMARAGHAQFVVATHSPILLACPDARIYSFDHVPVRPIRYLQSDHYRLYKSFMADPEAHLPGPDEDPAADPGA